MKNLTILSLFFGICLFNSCQREQIDNITEAPSKVNDTDIQYVREAMQSQQLSWNQGDIPGFMEHYWKSDSLMFIGKNGITYGWKQTLDNYLSGYSSPEDMGELTFENIEVRELDGMTIQVIGKWHLKRASSLGDLQGHYTLIWQKKKNQWVIISDHSS